MRGLSRADLESAFRWVAENPIATVCDFDQWLTSPVKADREES